MDRFAKEPNSGCESYQLVREALIYGADEIIKGSAYPGAEHWASDSLERRHIIPEQGASEQPEGDPGGDDDTRGSSLGGERLIRGAKKALTDHRPEVCEIYHKFFELGCKGSLFSPRHSIELSDLRSSLRKRVMTQQDGAQVCPEAYGATDKRDFKKPPLGGLVWILIGLLFVVFVLWITRGLAFDAYLGELDEELRRYANSMDESEGQ